MPKQSYDNLFMSPEEFFGGAVISDLFNQVSAEIVREESNTLIDEVRLERDKAWSSLSNQVVGGEDF